MTKRELAKDWSKAELRYMKRHYATTPNRILVKKLGRTEDAIKTRAKIMRLHKEPVWDSVARERLLILWMIYKPKQVAIEMNRSYWSVTNQHRKLTGKK